MGRTLYAYQHLLPPLARCGERYLKISANQTQTVPPNPFRVIYFVGCDHPFLAELPDGTRQRIEENDAIVVAQPWTLRYRNLGPSTSCLRHILMIHLDQECLELKRQHEKLLPWAEFAEQIRQQFTGFHHFPQALARDGGREILYQLRQEAERGDQASRWKLSSLCLYLVSLLLEPKQTDSKPPPDIQLQRGESAVEHARHYIEEHCHLPLTLTQIAWEVQLSGEHLGRLFKKHAKCTVFDAVHRARVEKAKQLLRTTELPVARVASACGYTSSNLLGRHFKMLTRMTPVAYRMQSRSKESFSPSQFA